MNSNYSAESPSFVFAKNKVILALGDSGSWGKPGWWSGACGGFGRAEGRELGGMGVQKRARILSSGSVSHILASQAWNQPVKMGGSAPCLMVEMGRPLRPEGSESTYSLAGGEGDERLFRTHCPGLQHALLAKATCSDTDTPPSHPPMHLLYVVCPGT
jgi:hypothetical protein